MIVEFFRTSPPPTYLPPTRAEMREAATEVGLKTFSPGLVADLCNIAAGGTVLPPSGYVERVAEQAETGLPDPHQGGKWRLSDGSWSLDRTAAIEDHTRKLLRGHIHTTDFLQSVDLGKFPGPSPLAQAMALLKLLSKQQGGSGGDGGEPLPVFAENSAAEKVAEQMNNLMDEVDSLSSDELDMLDPEGKTHEVSPEGDGQRSGSNPLNRLAVAEDLVEGADKREMLNISRKLDFFAKLQARRQVLLEQDPAGEEVRKRPIRSLSELGRIERSAWALRLSAPTLFLHQAVSGQLSVRERVTRMERKQAIFILVDGSGSMRGRKHWKATGVVMNRLKAVLTGDAEVFVSVFDTALGNVRAARTPDEARNLIIDFARGNFTGGGTDIAASVKSAHKWIETQIKEGAALYRPEVCVLTDEDSSVSGVRASEVPGTRVHGFAMEVANPGLINFAHSTGGVGIENF